MNNLKHICCACDDNYAQHCGVMLCSLFENNKQSTYIIHVLMNKNSLHEENCIKLKRLVESYHSVCIFHDVDTAKIQNMPDRKNRPLGVSTYFRLLFTSILDSSIRKVFYLDCDIIVNGNIDSIFDLQIDDYALAAVSDGEIYNDRHRMEIPIPYEKCNFCAGVMLINLDYWRKHNVEEKLISAGRKVRERCLHDQDALNAVFHNKWFRLPPKWNKFNRGYIGEKCFLTKADYKEYISSPIIIHFLSDLKPWQDIPGLRYRDLYWKYLAMTEWKDFMPQRRENESYRNLRKVIFFSNIKLWLAEHNVSWAYNFILKPLVWTKAMIMFPVRLIKR